MADRMRHSMLQQIDMSIMNFTNLVELGLRGRLYQCYFREKDENNLCITKISVSSHKLLNFVTTVFLSFAIP